MPKNMPPVPSIQNLADYLWGTYAPEDVLRALADSIMRHQDRFSLATRDRWEDIRRELDRYRRHDSVVTLTGKDVDAWD